MLRARERCFCELVASGLGYGEAYVQAGWRAGDTASAQAGGSRKMRNSEVAAEVRRLREAMWDERLLSVKEKRVLLAEIAQGRAFVRSREYLFEMPLKHSERIAAIAEDSRLAGDYAAEKRDVSVQGDLFKGLVELLNDDGGEFDAGFVGKGDDEDDGAAAGGPVVEAESFVLGEGQEGADCPL